MFKALSYDQVYLIPQYSPVHSRSEISTAVKFGPRTFKTPAVPANMKCTIDDDKAKWMSENGHFYIMHRFGETVETKYDDMYKFVFKANYQKWKTISISVGVQPEDQQFLLDCINAELQIDYITLDIAHADSIRAKEMLLWIKSQDFGAINPFVIVGNVATPEAVANLTDWGADAIKCGIAGGCFIDGTKVMTQTGEKNIEDIQVGEYVKTHAENYRTVVATSRYNPNEPTIKINDIECTVNHKFYVIRKIHRHLSEKSDIEKYAIWVEAGKLNEDYLLISP